MSGQALAAVFRSGRLVPALKAPLGWSRLVLGGRLGRPRRREGVAALPVRTQHLRDLGLVEADGRRLGLLE